MNNPLEKYIALSKRITFPGFQGLPLYEVSRFFVQALRGGSVNIRASAVAFKFMLAIFPAIIFVFTLIPYIPVAGLQLQLLDLFRDILPAEASALAMQTITDIVSNQRGELLSFGFLAALYFSTNGINAIFNAFNESYYLGKKRSAFRQRIIATWLVVILTFLILAGMALILLGGNILEYLLKENILKNTAFFFLYLFKWPVALLSFFCAVSMLYYFGSSEKKHWRFFSAGSTLATLLALTTTLAFSFFVDNFGRFNTLYGSLGAFIVIMLWLHINAMVLLIGFELNMSIRHARRARESF